MGKRPHSAIVVNGGRGTVQYQPGCSPRKRDICKLVDMQMPSSGLQERQENNAAMETKEALIILQSSSILAGAKSEELLSRPSMIATRAALLEASNQEAAALDLVTQLQTSLSADRQKSKAEKAATSKGLLPIIARLQLKVQQCCKEAQSHNKSYYLSL